MVAAPASPIEGPPTLYHEALHTTLSGVLHPLSTDETPVHQYLGLKYASIPARFRQSKLVTSYSRYLDASRHGPICPQAKARNFERDLFDLDDATAPIQALKQDEFECLNLNITCPGNATPLSNLPVMFFIHGGNHRGSGSSWLFDGGSLVQRSILAGKPVVLVSINYRLGLLGFAASTPLRDDNKDAGDEGCGNYGLRDQQRAMEWVHQYISAFGGNPANVTLFGEGSGAADILCHLHSAVNVTTPLFHRAIVQSALMELDIPTVPSAGWQLSRSISSLQCPAVEQLRQVEVEKLVGIQCNMRAVDDGVFFRKGWKESLFPQDPQPDPHKNIPELQALRARSRSRSRSRTPHNRVRYARHHPPHLQPLMIGDCGAESLLWSLPTSLWTGASAVKRIRAICQSLNKTSALLRAYDISAYTPDDELHEQLLELINDARFAWPTDRIATTAKDERGGHNVWRYVFDQESPSNGVPHHAVDLMYLFDTVPLPSLGSLAPPDVFDVSPEPSPTHGRTPDTPDMDFSSDSAESSDGRLSPDLAMEALSELNDAEICGSWELPVVDDWSYCRVRDAVQGRWLAFAYGEAPWREENVYVFGPEGEAGERSRRIFEGRRRTQLWKQALEPLGMQTVQKLGVELSNGPPIANGKVLC